MQARLADAKATGKVVVAHYRFDSMNVRLIVPFGVQTGLSLGFDSRGTVTEETYDASGAMISREQKPVRGDVRDAPGDRRPLAQRRGAAARQVGALPARSGGLGQFLGTMTMYLPYQAWSYAVVASSWRYLSSGEPAAL
jgi:hypothetical protein